MRNLKIEFVSTIQAFLYEFIGNSLGIFILFLVRCMRMSLPFLKKKERKKETSTTLF